MIEALASAILFVAFGSIGVAVSVIYELTRIDRELKRIDRELWKLKHDANWIVWRIEKGGKR